MGNRGNPGKPDWSNLADGQEYRIHYIEIVSEGVIVLVDNNNSTSSLPSYLLLPPFPLTTISTAISTTLATSHNRVATAEGIRLTKKRVRGGVDTFSLN
ncbi:MAG: hypothetical protein V1649_01680 [Patescibacteria group bacterium]